MMLKSEYRFVIILRGIQQYTIEETCSILDWDDNKVRITFQCALQSLRNKLRQGVEG